MKKIILIIIGLISTAYAQPFFNNCGGVDTDSQSLSINGQDLTISRGNTITLPSGGGSGWGLQGNNITAGDFIGTTNGEELGLKVNNEYVARFTANNSIGLGNLAPLGIDNTIILGSINGIGGSVVNTSVGIGTFEPTSRLHIEGSTSYKYNLINSSYTATESDNIIIYDGGAGQSITLPFSFGCYGRTYKIVNATNVTGVGASNVNVVVNALFDKIYNPLLIAYTTSYTIDVLSPFVTFMAVYPYGWVVIDK